MSDFDELLPDFVAETNGILQQLSSDLALLRDPGRRTAAIQSICRGVHSIKGASAVFNLSEVNRFCHELENGLNPFRSGERAMDEAEIRRLEKGLDELEERVAETVRRASGATPSGGAALGEAASESAVAAPERANAPVSEVIRVPADRVQKNLDVISEVILIRNQISYLMERKFGSNERDREFYQSWEVLDSALKRSISDLENIGLSMRMTPIKGLFSKLEKSVRDYSESSGKKIQFVIDGEETELDKKVIDALGEPLIHLVRNAMDHGIESPEKRRERSKLEEGKIRISAKLLGNEVLIEVSDDGAGIDAQQLIRAAQAKGIDVTHIRDNASALGLIFLPGFSTAKAVTDISGRGIGMDAVQTAIEKLGGSIQLETKVGQGSRFSILLPLGVSVIPAIIVKINDQLLAVGTNDVIETRLIAASELQRNAGQLYFRFRDQHLPCYDLENLFGNRSPLEIVEFNRQRAVCVVKTDQGLIAMAVSSFETNSEIVVKQLPAHAPKQDYVSGVSLLPTGEPIFVLSLGRVFRYRIAGGKYRGENDELSAG